MAAEAVETKGSSPGAHVPWVVLAGAVGAIVFVAIQTLAGSPQHIAEFMGAQIVRRGGYSESLAGVIGWGVHLAVALAYATLFALVIKLPGFPKARAPRWGAVALMVRSPVTAGLLCIWEAANHRFEGSLVTKLVTGGVGYG